ncbi:MAG: beta-galactosidase [Eubacterium sp.]
MRRAWNCPFDKDAYPYLTAELGGGVQVTHHRRPRVAAEDIGAMSVCKLGSGCNLLGYYMYHGGTNPKGKLSSLQESTAVGSFCDVPELSYDFQAPIREYGQISETAKELKLLSMFARDYGRHFVISRPQLRGMTVGSTSVHPPEIFRMQKIYLPFHA